MSKKSTKTEPFHSYTGKMLAPEHNFLTGKLPSCKSWESVKTGITETKHSSVSINKTNICQSKKNIKKKSKCVSVYQSNSSFSQSKPHSTWVHEFVVIYDQQSTTSIQTQPETLNTSTYEKHFAKGPHHVFYWPQSFFQNSVKH